MLRSALLFSVLTLSCSSSKEQALKELDAKHKRLESEVRKHYTRKIPNLEILTPEQEFKLIKHRLYAAGTICKECFEGIYVRCKDCCDCCHTGNDLCCCLHVDKCTCVKDPTNGE